MKLGILGGTFNPIHNGHLSIAEDARDIFDFDSVVFIPAKTPPLKGGPDQISPDVRYKIVKAAIEGIDRFEISDIEFKIEGPSYSVLTMQQLAKERGLSPKDLYFILGVDAFLNIHKWWSYKELFKLSNFILVSRAGIETDFDKINTIAQDLGFCYNKDVASNLKESQDHDDSQPTTPDKTSEISEAYDSNQLPSKKSYTDHTNKCRSSNLCGHQNNIKQNSQKGNLSRMLKVYSNNSHLNLFIIKTRPVLVSSTDIRKRIANGESIDDLVPKPVSNLIMEEYTTA